MRGRIILLGVLAALVIPAAAEARPPLTIARGKAAIAHANPNATVGYCRQAEPRRVDCSLSEYVTEGKWEGWTLHFTADARLSRSGKILVTTSI